jgi:hypothetical protein
MRECGRDSDPFARGRNGDRRRRLDGWWTASGLGVAAPVRPVSRCRGVRHRLRPVERMRIVRERYRYRCSHTRGPASSVSAPSAEKREAMRSGVHALNLA